MPRRKRTTAEVVAVSALDESERVERVAVFEKTKMCKFFILGSCTKGNQCRFAHDPSQLQQLPDLAKTKLCKSLIATGFCDNPDCKYAHNREELRPMPAVDPSQLEGRPRPLPPGQLPLTGAPATPAWTPPSATGSAEAGQSPEALAMMQAALAQMGQAAQAHAAEAARLQGMVTKLQALIPNEGGRGGSATSQAQLPQPVANGLANLPPSLATALAMGGHDDGRAPKLTVRNTFLEFEEPKTPVAPLRMVQTAAAALCSMADDGAGGDSPMSSQAVHGFGGEPVQILPEMLRTMSARTLSSGSLTGLLEEESHHDKNIFFTPNPQSQRNGMGLSPAPRSSSLRHRPSLTSLSEEDHLTSLEAKDVNSAYLIPPDVRAKRLPSPHGAGVFASFKPGLGVAAQAGPDAGAGCGAPTASARDGLHAAIVNALGNGSLQAGVAGVTVKNTFLDFPPFEQACGLRSVQTAAGRLQEMGQD